MKRLAIASAVLSALLAFSAATPSYAAIVKVDFAGFLTSAVNNPSVDPNIPAGDFFQVGQAFSGNFAYDNAIPVDLDGVNAFFDLQQFNVVIGGVDFSERFLPRLTGRSSDGSVEFLSGGASQGGSTSISTTLNSPFQNYPTAAELNGTTATFSFRDFSPLGGEVSGQALLTSAVPEASTWAMMILGFGFVGFAMRRRKPHSVVLPALAA